jgi:hypothetical protein
VEKIPAIINIYKNEWAFQRLMPKIMETLTKENGYLYRISALHCLKVFFNLIINAKKKIINIDTI